jgi:hypothetical protein
MMMNFSKSFIAVAQGVGLAVHAGSGIVCREGPMKILVRRSSNIQKIFSFLNESWKRKGLENVFVDSAVNWQGGKLC